MRLIHGILASLFPPAPEPIGELSEGRVVTVRGVVVPRDLMESPLTGDRCVYYQYAIEQWRQTRVVGVGGDGFWELVESDEAILEFYVQDDSGRAIVSPRRARVTRSRGATTAPVELAIHRRGRQVLLTPGDEIEVTALVERVDDIFDEGRGYRAGVKRLMLCAPEDDETVIRLIRSGSDSIEV